MDLILVAFRLLLAGIFFTAGLTKLVDRNGSLQAIRNFGITSRLAAPLTILLPLSELVIATALLSAVGAWWGSLGALGLLLIFMVGIVVNLAKGRTPNCHCFGQLYSKPIGWSTLARNGVFAAIAGLIVWQGSGYIGLSIIGLLITVTNIPLVGFLFGIAVLGILATQSWFIMHLLRQQGRLLLRIETLEGRLDQTNPTPSKSTVPTTPERGLPIGAKAPAFRLTSESGVLVSLETLLSPQKPLLLVFIDPGCGPCTALLPQVARWQSEYATKLTIALISRNPSKLKQSKGQEYEGLNFLLVQKNWEVSESYQVNSTPTAVLIQPDGTLGSPLAMGREPIENLVTSLVKPSLLLHVSAGSNGKHNGDIKVTAPAKLEIGQQAPTFKLPDLTGEMVDSVSFRGTATLLLFWSPACGFCMKMLDELKAWERNLPENTPKIVVISTGSLEVNRQMELESLVLLDQNFTIGRRFGAGGTPSAILIDEKGKVTSKVAIGAQQVLALAAGQEKVS